MPAWHRALPLRGRWIAFGLCALAGLAVRLAFPAQPAVALVQEALALACFAALWGAAMPIFERRPASPLHALGLPIAAALGVSLVLAVARLAGPHAPASAGAAARLQQQGLALLQMGLFLFLLLQLRRLVLYRRTRQSQHHWRLMLLLMTLAALTAFGRSAGRDLGVLQAVFIVPAVVLMVRNAFRLSWIIDLTVREKVAGAALSLGLLVAVSVALSNMDNALPLEPGHALESYSYALNVFALQAGIFGILYSLTALLSLVFHLPTTSDVQRRSDEMATLQSMTHLVDQAFDAERLAASIAAAPVEAGAADAAWLARPQAAAGPQVVAAHRLTPRQAERRVDVDTLFAAVRRTQAPLVLPHAYADGRVRQPEAAGDDRLGTDLASLLVVPLVTRGAFVGALFAARNVARGFEENDVSSIQAFASQAALALDHARLFEEQIEKERLERELSIARTVQQRLLPRRLPDVEGLALAAGSTPAREVGGDYYDFACLDDGRLAFVVADVSGKGASAAFYMAEMQGLFRGLSGLMPTPKAFLTRANETLRDVLEEGAFISVLYGLLDPARRTLTLARAGHCPVAFLREGEAPRLLRPDGIGLGLAPTPLFARHLDEACLSLHPGDTLVLYTDGLVESRSGRGEEYGYERLLQSLAAHGDQPPEALRAHLLSDLRTFISSGPYGDDLTLMTLRWNGPSPATPPRSEASPPRPAEAQPSENGSRRDPQRA